MTIKFPDLSHHRSGVPLDTAPALITKATQGAAYVDPTYAGYKAAAAGKPFAGYHWVESGALSSMAAQAAHALAVIGTRTPMMADIEVLTSSTGHQSWPTFDEALDWCRRVLAGGGMLTLGYIPEWFWAGKWGRRSLAPFADLGLALISSAYTTYADDGPGWDPYGGWAPTIWQYTSSAVLNGHSGIDMNAFRGSVDQLRAVFSGGSAAGSTEVDMPLTDADVAKLLAARIDTITPPAKGATQYTLGQALRLLVPRSDYVANTAEPAILAKLDALAAAVAAHPGAGEGSSLDAATVRQIFDDELAKAARAEADAVAPPTTA